MRKPNSKNGFTMVEMLVSVTIFSVIAAGIGASFMSGMKIWSRARRTCAAENQAILSLEIIVRQLRQALNLPAIGFQGEAAEFSFPLREANAVVKKTYRFDPQEKMLIARQSTLADVLAEKDKDNFTETKFMPLDALSVSYLFFDIEDRSYYWQDSWPKEKGVFTAIKIEAKVKDETFTKTVFIPAT